MIAVCFDYESRCANGICVNTTRFCDGVGDCVDLSDEAVRFFYVSISIPPLLVWYQNFIVIFPPAFYLVVQLHVHTVYVRMANAVVLYRTATTTRARPMSLGVPTAFVFPID